MRKQARTLISQAPSNPGLGSLSARGDRSTSLAIRYANGEKHLRHDLWMEAEGMVIAMARQIYLACDGQHEYDDLVSEGHIGLARAIEKFDPNFNRAFSTYAVWWIYQSMVRWIRSGGVQMIVVPSYLQDAIHLIDRDEVPIKPVADELVKAGRVAMQPFAALFAQDGNGVEFGDRADPHGADPATAGPEFSAEECEALREAFRSLENPNVRQAAAVCLGLDGHEVHTQKAAGRLFGCHHELVRQRLDRGVQYAIADLARRIRLKPRPGVTYKDLVAAVA